MQPAITNIDIADNSKSIKSKRVHINIITDRIQILKIVLNGNKSTNLKPKNFATMYSIAKIRPK